MLQNYLKIAVRTLQTQRTYTLLNVVGLSVGMAGGLLIFLFLQHHLSTDRHHANYDRIFRIDTDLHLDDGSLADGAGVADGVPAGGTGRVSDDDSGDDRGRETGKQARTDSVSGTQGNGVCRAGMVRGNDVFVDGGKPQNGSQSAQ
jgi:hypothetical protein